MGVRRLHRIPEGGRAAHNHVHKLRSTREQSSRRIRKLATERFPIRGVAGSQHLVRALFGGPSTRAQHAPKTLTVLSASLASMCTALHRMQLCEA